jgi:RHS repeat-associated protein
MPFTATGSDVSYVVTAATHQPWGPVSSLEFNSSDTDNYTYDLDYRNTKITSNVHTYQENLTYAYDGANNTTSITDGVTASNSQTLGFDVLNRLISGTSGTGGYGSLSWAYDKNGNLSSRVVGSTTYSYTNASGTNRLATSTWPSNSQTFSYTAPGNISQITVNGTAVFTNTYNNANRLASVSGAGVGLAITGITYDAFGKRITKTDSGYSPDLYTYDLHGHLLEDNDGAGITDYVYMDDQLVGNWQPSAGHVFFVHTDPLGTPIAATDKNDTTDWQATYTPYGYTQTLTTSGPLGSVVNNIRFPGQYFDHETSFQYNLHRNYEPIYGRYLEADPIGLAGGLNPYLYAGANPGKFVDPRGTDFVTAAVGALAGGYAGYITNPTHPIIGAALGSVIGAITGAVAPQIAVAAAGAAESYGLGTTAQLAAAAAAFEGSVATGTAGGTMAVNATDNYFDNTSIPICKGLLAAEGIAIGSTLLSGEAMGVAAVSAGGAVAGGDVAVSGLLSTLFGTAATNLYQLFQNIYSTANPSTVTGTIEVYEAVPVPLSNYPNNNR